ncbi:MAG: UDP-N-acetylmuramate--L-alanine ligase [Patescibacteria group bacterium]
MTKKPLPQPKPVAHFIGIGGIGTSALARWFLAQNWVVSGSDITSSANITNLKKEGARVKIGHKKANLPKRDLNMVIYSPAIRPDNPEIVEAKKRGLKPLSYPETLGCLTRVYKTIAVAGSHGKSTTTALAALTLIKAKLDPNVVVGTNLKELGNKNFRYGHSKWLVIEADEWKASFLNYSPDITIITNIDKEHLDFYKNLSDVKKTFLKFVDKTKRGGSLILNKNDKNLFSLKSPILKIAKKQNLKVVWYSAKKIELKKILRIPGDHNIANASAVLALAEILQIKKSVALKALRSYTGAWRRMEFKGFMIQDSPPKADPPPEERFRIPVYDDYAHHPTEIKASLRAFREKFPKEKVICVYQPHQAKRLKALFKEFTESFSLADLLIIIPVYEVAGRDKVTSTFTSKKLVEAIRKKYPQKEAYYLPSPNQVKKFLAKIFRDSSFKLHDSCIIMMGAGDIVNYTPSLLPHYE